MFLRQLYGLCLFTPSNLPLPLSIHVSWHGRHSRRDEAQQLDLHPQRHPGWPPARLCRANERTPRGHWLRQRNCSERRGGRPGRGSPSKLSEILFVPPQQIKNKLSRF
jgi:hypothetical protein